MAKTQDTILKLVENFEQNIDSFKGQGYNEAQLRQEFINPFFEALGWDIQNKSQTAAAYKDVIHEDAIKIGGTTKAPDYCFRIGATKKFFVEAKKPAVDIKNNSEPAYQLRRYAWSAKLPLSILTDFEEFAVYDCQIRPNVNDKPSTGRILLINYKEYGEKWEQIANIFSKDAVYKGLFDKFASEKTVKKGTTTVDKEFLTEIENWRGELAKNIANRNERLSVNDLNFAVQKTIDRILFLRICEDRGIERSEQLLGYINGTRIYPRLFELFEKSDERYNSGIFHFRRETARSEQPDEIAARLKVDDDVLKKIIRDMYYPCPYEFSVMPAEILGQVYEQFLGKVIRLTAAHQAKVEEKPEVKKAGGVYYTPSYIVDYIVKNTVGKLCEGKTPRQIEKIKILDPACGSGSFLIGAYQELLDYHRDWYLGDGKEIASSSRSGTPRNDTPPRVAGAKYNKKIYRGKGGQWFLTIEEKKKILLNNIFGVDIDSQAVEVTKLSLLLKVLENETQESLRLFHERALPDLGNNIKCGNSLIGPDFYQNQQLNLFDDEQQRKINAFDWEKEFEPVFKQGGFDAVIGNPPYRSLLLGKKQVSEHSSIIRYFSRKLPNASSYKINLFGLFIEKCTYLLLKKGLFSFIIPELFFTSYYFRELRKYMLNNGSFSTIFDLRYKVFGEAEIGGNGIFVFTPSKNKKTEIVISNSKNDFDNPQKKFLNSKDFIKDVDSNLLLDGDANNVMNKMRNVPTLSLGNICIIYQGIITGDNKRFLSNRHKDKNWEKILRGKDINKYHYEFGNTYVLYDPEKLWSNTNPKMFKVKEKLISRQTSDRLIATIDTNEYLSLDSTHVIHLKNQIFSIKYLLGIYNSRLLTYFYAERVKESGRVFAQVKVVNLNPLPIRTIDFKKAKDKKQHDKMVSLVEQMLELNKKVGKIRNPNEKERMQRQINATDGQIDKLVYELYGLTAEEIKIVEGKEK